MIRLTETARFELGPHEEEILYKATSINTHTDFGDWMVDVYTGTADEPANIDIFAYTAQDDYLRAACLVESNKPTNWRTEISLRFATINAPDNMRALAAVTQHLADICEKVQEEIIPHL